MHYDLIVNIDLVSCYMYAKHMQNFAFLNARRRYGKNGLNFLKVSFYKKYNRYVSSFMPTKLYFYFFSLLFFSYGTHYFDYFIEIFMR